jgi:hypothetical protein
MPNEASINNKFYRGRILNIEHDEIFNGKTVFFRYGTNTLGMKNVSFQTVHNRKFVTGMALMTTKTANKSIAQNHGVDWGIVTSFTIFNTEEEYFEWLKTTK